jgi:ribosomal protein S14
MKIWDFPTEQPKVESRYLKGIHVKHNPNAMESLCEICGKNDSEYMFNIGMTHHHLCGNCFREMVEQFTKVVK